MSTTQELLQATRRTHLGTKHTRRARQNGQIPAIVYGHGQDPVAIALEGEFVEIALKGHARLLKVNLEGKPDQFLIKSVQYDHMGSVPIHLDLMRVDLDERVTVRVQVELRGVPKGAAEGGVLQQMIAEVELECVVTAIPEYIRHSVVDMAVNQVLHISDLRVPQGVTILDEPNAIVALCRIPTEAPVAGEEVVAGAEGTEPEVIGRKPDEEGGEEEEGKKK
jgi:large subunit ribosomal protein L25